MLHGSAEDAQCCVALELVDQAAVLLRHGDDRAEEVVEQRDDLLWWTAHGEARRSQQVDEEHSAPPSLPTELDSVLEGATDHTLADVTTEEVTQLFALAETGDHAVETSRQQPHLGAVRDLHCRVQVATLHVAQGRAYPSDGLGDEAPSGTHCEEPCSQADG